MKKSYKINITPVVTRI